MNILENIVKRVLDKGTVEQKIKLNDSVYKIQIKSEDISKIDFYAGSFLRLAVGVGKEATSLRDKMRSYTIWDIDKTNRTLDLAIATHGKGIGTKWVENCEIGDIIFFKLKKGKFLTDSSADSYLMIGDLSSLSHYYIIKRDLPKEKQIESIIYSQDINDFFVDVDGANPFECFEMEQNPYDKIIGKLQTIVPKLKGKSIVYLAGDSRICVALNKYFRKELNWDAKRIKTKPFWNPDKTGLE
ncbi:MAG: siderophore-interacting protein [Thermonemataceae bacterium]